MLAVHVARDDRHPLLFEVARQLGLDPALVDRDGRRDDERALVVALPERVDDARHEAQHAARLLELLERGPGAEELVEELGMDRVAGRHPALVRGFLRLGREVARMLGVHVRECLDRRVAGRAACPPGSG